MDTFNALAPSARHYITELQGFSMFSVYDPVDHNGIYKPLIQRMEADLY